MTTTTNPNKALWEKGDFTRIAETMRESGEQLVGKLGITEGMKVLDLGCGDGTTAVPEAKLGADVLGVDISSPLVAAGNARAEAEGLTNLKFQEGDATDLHELGDEGFDLVVSVFGAMFAPKPFDVAKEMVRVTKPGGRIVMGNWIPNDPTLVAQILKISASYSPPPPDGFVSPVKWGVEDDVIERFTAAGVAKEQISFERDTYTFNYPGTPEELVAVFRDYYGPTMNAFDAAKGDGKEADLQAELEALFKEQNTTDDGTSIPATFLRVTVAALGRPRLMYFRQFLNDETACASYLFGCKTAGKFAVVDAHADLIDDYIAAAEGQGSEITAVIETHVQADHVSGLPELVKRTGATAYMPEGSAPSSSTSLSRTVSRSSSATP